MSAVNQSQTKSSTASSIVLSLILALIVLVAPVPSQTAFANGGSITYNNGACDLSAAGYLGTGAVNDRYQISDSESLWEMADCSLTGSPLVSAYFFIMSDIDASSASAGVPTHSPIGYVNSSLAYSFSGILEGGQHTISVSMSTDHGVGLFAYLHSATIQNLEIAGSFSTTTTAHDNDSHSAGGLAIRSLENTALVAVVNSATVAGRQNVGGLIGSGIEGLTISESSNSAHISGGSCVGGLVGNSRKVVVRGASNTSAVTGIDAQIWTGTSSQIGGLIGCAQEPAIVEDSENTGPISGGEQVGGLIGRTFAGPGSVTVSGSINSGQISADSLAGGLIGFVNDDAKVINSTNSGTVSATVGDYSGGLVGFTQDNLTIESSTNQGAVNGARDFVGGLAGSVRRALVISWSKNIGDVTGQIRTAGIAGFVGKESNLLEVENNGNIRGTGSVGGLIGWASESANISGSLNQGNVTGTSGVGGFIGDARSNSLVSGSTNSGDISSSSLVGGFVGLAKGNLELDSLINTGEITGGPSVGGLLGSGASIGVNLSLNRGRVSGTSFVGGLIGHLTSQSGIVESVNDGEVVGSGTKVGGLIGDADGPAAQTLSIFDSSNLKGVTGGVDTGGLVGYVSMRFLLFLGENYGTIRGSVNSGGLIGNLYLASGSDAYSSIIDVLNAGDVIAAGGNVGGIVGNTSTGASHTLLRVHNAGDVTATGTSVGGIFGRLDITSGNSTASQISNDGDISGLDNVGGLFGTVADPLHLEDSSNRGDVNGANVGGLVGNTLTKGATNIVNSFNSGVVSGTSKVDGLVGSESAAVTIVSSYTSVPSSFVATSTIAQMQSSALYVGWNFDSVWGFGLCSSGQGLPQLRYLASGFSSTACVAENSGITPNPQTPAPSYLGPIISAKVSGQAGEKVLLRGSRLNLITAISIAGLEVEILSASAEAITIVIPVGLTAGVKDLIVQSSLGRVTFMSLLEVMSQKSESPSLEAANQWIGKSWMVPGSKLGSVSLSSFQRNWMTGRFKNSDVKRVVCTAITTDQMTAHQRILVRKAAKAACKNVSSHLQAPSVWVQSKKTKHAAFSGRVLLTVKG